MYIDGIIARIPHQLPLFYEDEHNQMLPLPCALTYAEEDDDEICNHYTPL